MTRMYDNRLAEEKVASLAAMEERILETTTNNL
jgi:hypothetical protein